MGGSHAPHPATRGARPRGGRLERGHLLVLAVVAPLVLAAVLAMLWLSPAGPGSPGAVAGADAPDVSEETETAAVVSATAAACPGAPPDRLPDGSVPDTALCATSVVEVLTGEDRGSTITVPVPPQVYRAGLEPGDRLQLARYASAGPGEDGAAEAVAPSGDVYGFVDFERGRPLVVLAVAFALLVVGVARVRGLAALAGLVLAYLTIIYFMLPALREGASAVGVALSGSVVLMAVILYLAHGFTVKTSTALLGTVFGLVASAMLAAWASEAAHLNGLTGEDTYLLSTLTSGGDLSGIILCGIIVAGLGVLNDVTITQASAVWEVHEHAPDLGFGALFRSGMRVGRDHLASTVYTIAFAYAGAALPTLLLIDLYDRPLAQVLTSGEIAEEVARTGVGAIGLVLAIPLTTAVAAAAIAVSGRPARGRRPGPPPEDGTEWRPRSREARTWA